MKKLLLLSVCILGIGCCAMAQTQTAQATVTYPEDQYTLEQVIAELDKVSVFDLQKLRERYVYRCTHNDATDRNKAILASIEEHLKSTK